MLAQYGPEDLNRSDKWQLASARGCHGDGPFKISRWVFYVCQAAFDFDMNLTKSAKRCGSLQEARGSSSELARDDGTTIRQLLLLLQHLRGAKTITSSVA